MGVTISLHVCIEWLIYEWVSDGMNISYQFVVYIHRHLFSYNTAVLTNHSS